MAYRRPVDICRMTGVTLRGVVSPDFTYGVVSPDFTHGVVSPDFTHGVVSPDFTHGVVFPKSRTALCAGVSKQLGGWLLEGGGQWSVRSVPREVCACNLV